MQRRPALFSGQLPALSNQSNASKQQRSIDRLTKLANQTTEPTTLAPKLHPSFKV
jgi:hypothetical protein